MTATLGLTRAAFGAVQRASPRLAAVWAERIFCTPPRRPISERMASWLREAQRFTVVVGGRRVVAWAWGQRGPGVLLVHGWGSRGARFVDLGNALLTEGYRVVFLAPSANANSYSAQFAALLGVDGPVMASMRGRLERRLGFSWKDLNIPALASGMRVPLLVIHDRDDREVGWGDGAAIAQSWPRAELVTTTGLGHHRIVSDPAVIRQVVTFLSRSSVLYRDGARSSM